MEYKDKSGGMRLTPEQIVKRQDVAQKKKDEFQALYMDAYEFALPQRQHLIPRATGDDGELVGRLRYTYEHGIFVAAENGMLAGADEAADRIEALSAEVGRLKADGRLLINDCDCIGMKSPMLENFRQALGAKP